MSKIDLLVKVVDWQQTSLRSLTFSIKKVLYRESLRFIRSSLLLLFLYWKKFGFGNNFVSWVETLISKKESCAINSGNTTQYFHLERGTRQGELIWAQIFILALEVLSFLIRNNKDIKGLNFLIILFYTQLMQMIQRFFLKTWNQ